MTHEKHQLYYSIIIISLRVFFYVESELNGEAVAATMRTRV